MSSKRFSEGLYPWVPVDGQASTPATPAAGTFRLFLDGDGLLKWVDDAGAVKEAAPQVGTTKGDLYVHDGTVLTRLGVGTDDQVLTADAAASVGVTWADAAAGGATTTVGINTQTASYTLVADDAGKVVRMDAGTAVDLTVPAEASVDYDVGTVVGVRQAGAGTVTVVEDTGVTVNIEAGLTLDLRGQYAEVSLHKVGADTWEAVGGFAEDES